MTDPVAESMTEPVTAPLPVAAEPWRRLDRRMLVVHPVVDVVKLLPVLVLVAVSGASDDDRWRIGIGLVATVAVLAIGVSRWFTTTYRIGSDRVELRTGLLRRQHRSVHRDRIRTADLTANPAHRVFGLAVVRVGTGTHDQGEDAEMRLDAVGHAEAERLRAELLGTRGAGAAASAPDPQEIARLHWAWVRFAPLTFSALAVVGAVWAALLRTAEELGWSPDDAGRLRDLGGQAPIWLGGVALLVTAVVGAAVVFAEGWWGYRLTRGDDGGLVVRRGLLTRRSLTLEGRRLRGVELDEPLLLRLGRGARPRALTTGLRGGDDGGEHVGSLSPAVPRREAHRIAAAALGTPPDDGTATPLQSHPPAAVRRRYTRAVLPCVLVALAVFALLDGPVSLGVPVLPGTAVAAGAGLAVGVVLGRARARALGHALTATHLVARQGAWVRRTVVLRRDGVIGWRVHQSFVQRRTGLVTLVVVSAAGRGRYEVLDVGADAARALVDALSPGTLDPFARPRAAPAVRVGG